MDVLPLGMIKDMSSQKKFIITALLLSSGALASSAAPAGESKTLQTQLISGVHYASAADLSRLTGMSFQKNTYWVILKSKNIRVKLQERSKVGFWQEGTGPIKQINLSNAPRSEKAKNAELLLPVADVLSIHSLITKTSKPLKVKLIPVIHVEKVNTSGPARLQEKKQEKSTEKTSTTTSTTTGSAMLATPAPVINRPAPGLEAPTATKTTSNASPEKKSIFGTGQGEKQSYRFTPISDLTGQKVNFEDIENVAQLAGVTPTQYGKISPLEINYVLYQAQGELRAQNLSAIGKFKVKDLISRCLEKTNEARQVNVAWGDQGLYVVIEGENKTSCRFIKKGEEAFQGK